MNASELGHIWNTQSSLEPSPENIVQIAATVRAVDRKFLRKIWWRDLREIGAALVCATVFGFAGRTWLRWIAVASCLFVVIFILRSRWALNSRSDSTVVERLRQMIRETEMQIQLVRSLPWWYLLPCAIATLVFAFDRLPERFGYSDLFVFAATMAPFYLAIYWLNLRAVRKTLEPRRANLERALTELSQQS